MHRQIAGKLTGRVTKWIVLVVWIIVLVVASGFAANDLSMMVPGLIFALISGLLMSFGIAAVSRENNFPQIARLVILFPLGLTCWSILAQPVRK